MCHKSDVKDLAKWAGCGGGGRNEIVGPSSFTRTDKERRDDGIK